MVEKEAIILVRTPQKKQSSPVGLVGSNEKVVGITGQHICKKIEEE